MIQCYSLSFTYVSYKHECFKHISMNHSGQLETNYLPAQQLELNSVLNPLCKFEFKICKRDSTYFIRFAYVSYKHVRYKPILATDSNQSASDLRPAQQSELGQILMTAAIFCRVPCGHA